VVTAVAGSPVLASWTQVLAAAPVPSGWWMPRRVAPAAQWLLTAAVAVVLSVPAGGLLPWPAWVLFAAGGAVLAVVDVGTHRLPARLIYPLAAVITTGLFGASLGRRHLGGIGPRRSGRRSGRRLWFRALAGMASRRRARRRTMFALAAGIAGYPSWITVLGAGTIISQHGLLAERWAAGKWPAESASASSC